MIGVLVEHGPEGIAQSALEVMTVARTLGEPVALWLGDRPSAEDVGTLSVYGASEVRIIVVGEQSHVASTASAALVEAAADLSVLLGVSTFASKEVATRFATSVGAGMVVDASRAEWVDGRIETEQVVLTATWLVRTRIVADRAVVLLRPNSVKAEVAPSPGEARLIEFAAPAAPSPETLVAYNAVASEGARLAEARVVVAGGRGTGGDYGLIRELAHVLGAAVGASRDATDEGWIGHEHMVGQTGATVSPSLYVACGISGAVHHRGGMQGSATIVAINTDRDAPIFEIADFGIVGDLFEVLPQTIAALGARRKEGPKDS